MILEKETALFKDSAISHDISGAQSTADEKNAVFYQATAPPVTGRKMNDVWFDTDDDNTMYKFDGDGWALQKFGKNAIVAGSITTAVLDTQDLYTNFLVTNILNAAHAVISDLSAITANIGEITAGVLKSSNFLDGSGTYTSIGMIIDLEAGTIRMPKFAVTSSGVLYATDAILSGTITATDGEIGGFAIDSTSIHTKEVAITSNASGSIGLSSSTFTRTIGGIARSGLKFAIGSKFGVTETGVMYARDAIISGALALGGADNANGSITMYDASGNPIGYWNKDGITATAGTIGGWKIENGCLSTSITLDGVTYTISLNTYTKSSSPYMPMLKSSFTYNGVTEDYVTLTANGEMYLKGRRVVTEAL